MGISSSLPTTILPSNIPSEPDSVFRKLDLDIEFRDRYSYDLSDHGEEYDDRNHSPVPLWIQLVQSMKQFILLIKHQR